MKRTLLLLMIIGLALCAEPVRVLSVLPSSDNGALLQGRDTITVVFNSAVIALGSDWGSLPSDFVPFAFVSHSDDDVNMPGRFRWVTTSIARFDPDIDWPADLDFTIRIIPTKTYNGRLIANFSGSAPRYTTAQTTMNIQSVSSKMAQDLTDNHWSSSTPRVESGQPISSWEIPPDGEITVGFNTMIDYESVGSTMDILDSAENSIQFTYKPCISSVQCIIIVPRRNSLRPGMKYSIVFPSGSKTSQYSGVVRKDLKEQVYGLYPFKIPFLPYLSEIEGNRFAMYLRHGIEDSSKSGFANSLSITPPIHYEVSFPSKDLVVVSGAFKPSSTYTITIEDDSAVLDGFGLGLVGSQLTFKTAPGNHLVLQPTPRNSNFRFQNFTSNWTVFSRDAYYPNCGNFYVESVNVNNNNLVSVLATLENYQYSFVSPTRINLPSSTPLDSIDVTVFPTQTLFGTSGVWLNLESTCVPGSTVYSVRKFLVSRDSYGVTSLVGNGVISVWVTRTDSNMVAPSVTVKLYGYAAQAQWKTSGLQPADIIVLAQATTDNNGLATLTLASTDNYYGGWIVVEGNGVLHLSNKINFSGKRPSSTANIPKISIITDRSFHNPGDKIFIKGYIREETPNHQIVIPKVTDWTFSIIWRQSDSVPTQYSAQTSELGTFDLEVTVPSDATYGGNQFSARSTLDSRHSASIPIYIASPRIPTTKLEMSTTKSIYTPVLDGEDTSTKFNFTLATYTGQGIPNTNVTIRWKINRVLSFVVPEGYSFGWKAVTPTIQLSTKEETGEAQVTTDSSGMIKLYSLNLENLEKPLEEGNSVIVTAEYFSPTKELLSVSKSLTVGFSELSISMKLTSSGVILPGFEFGAFVITQDTSTSSAVSGISVKLALYEWDNVLPSVNGNTGRLADLADHTSLVKECSFITVDGGTNVGCTFTMTKISKYLLVAETQDSKNYTVTSLMPIGRNQTEWDANPLNHFNDITFILDKEEYTIPSTVSLNFFNPFVEAKVLIRWGNAPTVKYSVSDEQRGATRISVPIGTECIGGCNLDLVVTAPRAQQSDSSRLPVPIPVSVLFDATAPVSIVRSFNINVKEIPKQVKVDISLDANIAVPGSNSGFTVEISQGGNPVSGELALFVVDKAVLDLMPHPVLDYANVLSQRYLAQYFNIFDDRDSIAHEKSYIDSRGILQRRLTDNPWIDPDWNLYTSGSDCNDDLDISDEDYFANFIQDITFTVPGSLWYSGCTRFSNNMFDDAGMEGATFAAASFKSANGMPPLPPPAGSESVADRSQTQSAQAQVAYTRSNFVTTPLFIGKTLVNATGKTHIDWKLPDNIGTFEVRAYVITQDNAFGSATKNQLSRRLFSLQSSAPRIVRYMDRFFSGVSVTIHEDSFDDDVILMIKYVCEIIAPLTPSTNTTVHLKGPGPHLITFPFLAIGIGEGNIIFTLIHNNIQMDSAAYPMDIRGQQEPVFIATSFAVSAPSNSTEGYVLPSSVAFSGVLTVDAGVGRLPAIQYLTNIAKSRVTNQQYVSSDNYLTLIAAHISLAKYKLLENTLIDEAISKIVKYSVPNYGLQLIDPYYNNNDNYYYTYIELQAIAMFVIQKVDPGTLSAIQYNQLTNLLPNWRQAAERALVEQATWLRNHNSVYSQFDTLAYVFLGAGPTWQITNEMTTTDIIQDLSLYRLLRNTQQLSASGKAALALVLLSDSNVSNINTGVALLEEIVSSFRVEGRSAYLTEPHSSNPNFIASALALLGFVKSKNTSPLVEKLANFNSMSASGRESLFSSMSSFQIVFSVLGLSEYDRFKGNSQPNLHLVVGSHNILTTNGSSIILNASFNSPLDPPAHSGLFFEDIPDSEGISFTASGRGEASVVFGAWFIPSNVSVYGVDRGIKVNKIIQRIDPQTKLTIGPNIQSVNIGELVMVTIEISIPDYSSSITISDNFPGGIEPLDPVIYTTASSTSDTSTIWPRSKFGMVYDYWQWYLLRGFSRREYRKDKVVFYGENLYSGTHTVTYVALVTTQGKFVLPPAHAWDTTQPELMGLSSGGEFNVIGPELDSELLSSPLSRSDNQCVPWDYRQTLRNQLLLNVPTPLTYPQAVSGIVSAWWVILFIVIVAIIIGGLVYAKQKGHISHLLSNFKNNSKYYPTPNDPETDDTSVVSHLEIPQNSDSSTDDN